ncbi:hypothetical protein ACJZ2D_001363 [Fusarium nematophilum]
MLELGLQVTRYAEAIGEALAIIHWAANVDGYDIEFVLGSEAAISPTGNIQPSTIPRFSDTAPDAKKRALRLWVLDYNLCSRWEEKVGWEQPDALIQQLVMAFFENDPYYPLPLMEDELDQSLWLTFTDQYLRKAEEILASKDTRLQSLPVKFIEACIERERRNLYNGMDPGHRDHKG